MLNQNDNPGTYADVIVVGAGPAGSTAARKLSEAGFSTLVLDSKMEIGAPVICADLVNLGFSDLSELMGNPRVKLLAPDSMELRAGTSSLFFHPSGSAGDAFNTVVERDRLDKELISRAVLSGAKLRIRAEFISASQHDDIVIATYKAAGKTITAGAGHIIIATGYPVNGPDNARRKGMAYNYQYSRNITRRESTGPVIGIGQHLSLDYMVPRGNSQYNNVRIEKASGPLEASRMVSGPGRDIISGSRQVVLQDEPELGNGRILKIGSAAGLYDRFFLSGFRESFMSGCLAAEAIAESQENALRTYAGKVETGLLNDMKDQLLLRGALGRSNQNKINELFSTLSGFDYNEVSVKELLAVSGLSISKIEGILGQES